MPIYSAVPSFSPSHAPSLRPSNSPPISPYPTLTRSVFVMYYEGFWSDLPDFSSLIPYKTDYLEYINFVGKDGNFITSGRSDGIGAVFDGYVRFPTAGIWTLYTKSDDGSKLFVDGIEIVNNGGLHGAKEVSGAIEVLYDGEIRHVNATFFERGGRATMIVSWKGPDVSKEPIPPDAWVILKPTNDPSMTPSFSPSHAPSLCHTSQPFVAGIEQNVPKKEIKNRGWKRCFHGTYNNTLDSETIIKRCRGKYIMYGCGEEGNSFWNLVGYGNKTSALTPTTSTTFGTIDGSVQWYFQDNPSIKSIGFAEAGVGLLLNSCDLLKESDPKRLCWHLASEGGGFRCGNATSLNDSADWERAIWVKNSCTGLTNSPL